MQTVTQVETASCIGITIRAGAVVAQPSRAAHRFSGPNRQKVLLAASLDESGSLNVEPEREPMHLPNARRVLCISAI